MHYDSTLWLDELPLYALVVPHSTGYRLRVWNREWDTLGFEAGQHLTLKLPEGEEQQLLLASVVRVPEGGDSWIHLVAPVASRRSLRLPA